MAPVFEQVRAGADFVARREELPGPQVEGRGRLEVTTGVMDRERRRCRLVGNEVEQARKGGLSAATQDAQRLPSARNRITERRAALQQVGAQFPFVPEAYALTVRQPRHVALASQARRSSRAVASGLPAAIPGASDGLMPARSASAARSSRSSFEEGYNMRLERASGGAVPPDPKVGAGRSHRFRGTCTQSGRSRPQLRRIHMNGIIYLVGLVVVVMFVLSFLGLR